MKAFAITVRSIALLAVGCCLIGVGARSAEAQTVTLSPTRLTFGVPTGSTVSAPETVTFTVTGGDGPTSVTLGQVTRTNSDFTIATDSCSNTTITSPGSCSVSVTFTPNPATPGTLETGTLSFPNNHSDGTPTVALSGASGAIKLFDPINVDPSNPHESLQNLLAFKSETLAVSCSAEPSAILSSSPDGLGNVLVDNFLTLNTTGTTQPTPITTDNLVGNVCPGNLGNPSDGGQPNCFTTAYQNPAGAGQLDGQNPDTFTNGDNGVLAGGAAGGVPPINVSSQFSANTTNATITLLDGGGKVASSSLFLKTNCSSTGVKTGGTITGNPLDPNAPGSLTQDFPFNTTPGNHITFTGNFVTANSFDGTTTPAVSDTGLTQSQFASLVAGSSAAPAICIRLNGEVADDGVTKLCKAFTITCTDSSGSSAGVHCPQSAARTLLFETKLDSPDAVVIAPGTGPGMLMGTDNWASSAAPCGTFGPGDGEVANQLCPQNPLTEFKGTGDPISGSTPRGVNSTFIPVLNMPLPLTTFTTTPPMTATGWVNSRAVTIHFSSTRATYSGPNPNGFTPAPIASFTYGTQTPVPDPTFPASGDISSSNGSCPAGGTEPFVNNVALTFPSDGTFNNVHYFATDCASTEELLFTPNTDPTVNWASYKTVPIKIDTVPPSVGAITFTPSSTGNIFGVGQSVHVTFTCSDDLSGIASCLGPSGFVSGGLLNTSASQVGTHTFTVTAMDNAGNTQTSQVNYQIVAGSDLLLLNFASSSVRQGNNLTYQIVVLNLGPSVADNVVVTDTLPAGTSFVSAGFGIVTCSFAGCSDMPGPGAGCSVSGNLVTCNIPTVGLLFRSFTGALVKIVVNVNAAPGTTLRDTASVKAANPDPNPGNNSFTATTRVVNH